MQVGFLSVPTRAATASCCSASHAFCEFLVCYGALLNAISYWLAYDFLALVLDCIASEACILQCNVEDNGVALFPDSREFAWCMQLYT